MEWTTRPLKRNGMSREWMEYLEENRKRSSFELWNIGRVWHVLRPGDIALFDGCGTYKRLCLEGTLEECLHVLTGDVVEPVEYRIA